MAEVDRVAVDDVGLSLLSMMENAGRNLAKASRAVVGDLPESAFVAAGGGGNGGGGLAAARHLANHGVDVTVGLDRPRAELDGATADQAAALDATPADVVDTEADVVNRAVETVLDVDVAIDALIGYGLTNALDGTTGDLAQIVDQGAVRSLSLDVPSGFDATTGDAPGRTVHPNATITLGLPKTGLANVPGDLLLGDIAIPRGVYERADVPAPDPTVFDGQYVVGLATRD
jgi:NAD(P)H-hydrate epimerase